MYYWYWQDQNALQAVRLKIQAKFYSAGFVRGFDYSFLGLRLLVGWLQLNFYKADSDWCTLRLVCSRVSVCGSSCWHFRALSGSLGEADIGNKSLVNYIFHRIIWVHLNLVYFEDRWFAAGAHFGIKMYFHRYMNLSCLYYVVINYLKYFIS